MGKSETVLLKTTIPLDPSQESDSALLEFFDSLPQGMKANVLRRLLIKSLPRTDAELEALLGHTAMDAVVRGQKRGRPRREERRGWTEGAAIDRRGQHGSPGAVPRAPVDELSARPDAGAGTGSSAAVVSPDASRAALSGGEAGAVGRTQERAQPAVQMEAAAVQHDEQPATRQGASVPANTGVPERDEAEAQNVTPTETVGNQTGAPRRRRLAMEGLVAWQGNAG